MPSDARAFFETHRALFEYDTYFPGQDPCASASSGHSFAQLCAPSSSVSSSSFADAMTALTASAVPTIRPPPPTPMATTYWTKPLVVQLPSRPVARPYYEARPHYVGPRESAFPPPLSQPPVAAALKPAVPEPLPLQPTAPVTATLPPMTLVAKAHESSSKANGTLAPTKELSRQASATSNPLPRGPPLLDSSVRAYTRKVDMAQKIEMLVGPKFGRVFGPSSNLPLGVKRRLEAYARLDQRKEALYQLLLSEQHALVALRHTR
ncbi:hypothetical protein SDRG_06345 [Saprolegnia diclina VS20]|uniref:Uncharacterized protein n=1 Tax=Saprolegnia diclina (strain VS20) TaxID=1156394 RepID=T0RUU0_SAPDV|nr:hypothetical protein SDRG_06345 [Saprolegnia diclina VS20]EQC36238.1 hypothetical protein SDRG_06345 [Saprolegnia diclina VS20]|eukprot:XP_008610344.1 hypothetical protein SDRG_06345 [Saprolegnia diclina VS20]